MSRFHTIHTMPIGTCQEMLLSGDYKLINRGNIPLFSISSKKAYSAFVEQLYMLFGGEDEIIKNIDKDVLIQSMAIRIDNLKMLMKSLSLCYELKDFPKKIELLDDLKKHYRKIFNTYPENVDASADLETQKEQINKVLQPITRQITILSHKLKALIPQVDKEEEREEEKDNKGLSLHILFVESVENRNIDRGMSVYEFKLKYDNAVKISERNKNING